MTAEEWRDIPGYEGFYQASTLGRIRRSFRILSPMVNREGYQHLTLSVRGARTPVGVHQLVARTFIGEPTGPLVRHLDGDPANNVPSNLAYGTPSENNIDTVRHGRHNYAKREACSNGHAYTPENTRMNGRIRVCRQCDVVRSMAYQQRKAAVAS